MQGKAAALEIRFMSCLLEAPGIKGSAGLFTCGKLHS